MSKVDDELTRRLRAAERPVDGGAVFDALARRRSHRERVRRVQGGLLALAVLAATAVGFVALGRAFDTDERDVGMSPSPGVLPANGEIVFSRQGGDGRLHLFASNPNGTGIRQITEGSSDDSSPDVSPDGQSVAFVRILDERTQRIAIVGVDGGEVTNLSEDYLHATDPAWSPNGATLAHVTTGIDSEQIVTIGIEDRQIRYLIDSFGQVADPTWSPDGTRIAYSHESPGSQGLVSIIPTNEMSEGLAEETLGAGSAPAWSPDGSTIALIRSGDEGDEVWMIDLGGGSEVQLAAGLGTSLEPDLAWAPDGTALLVSDGEWIYRVNATPGGDPRDDFERLVEGHSPAWQPLPVELEPKVTTSPEPESRDIGLGFPLCNPERLGGIDWYGDGTSGAAWTGVRGTPVGRCPEEGTGDYVVAADLDGDGTAEPGGMGFLEFCLLCRPFAASDLSGDGVLELVVLEEASSTPSYSFYEVSVPTSERSPGIYNLSVAPPGAPNANVPAGGPLHLIVGGDEGFSGGLRCENYPDAPVLIYTGLLGEVDANTGLEGHETRLRLGEDGIFHVLNSSDFTVPRSAKMPDLISTEPACGVDFHPDA